MLGDTFNNNFEKGKQVEQLPKGIHIMGTYSRKIILDEHLICHIPLACLINWLVSYGIRLFVSSYVSFFFL